MLVYTRVLDFDQRGIKKDCAFVIPFYAKGDPLLNDSNSDGKNGIPPSPGFSAGL